MLEVLPEYFPLQTLSGVHAGPDFDWSIVKYLPLNPGKALSFYVSFYLPKKLEKKMWKSGRMNPLWSDHSECH